MKICPYILARLICKDENPSARMETVLDYMQGYEGFQDNKRKIVVSFACVGEFCGKYNACNPQSTQENQHDKKSEDQRSDMDYVADLWISQRSYNILKRVVCSIGWKAARNMSKKEWLREYGCGKKSALEIWDALHNTREDNA